MQREREHVADLQRADTLTRTSQSFMSTFTFPEVDERLEPDAATLVCFCKTE